MIDWLLALTFIALVFAVIALPGFLKRRRQDAASAYSEEERAEIEAQVEASRERFTRENPDAPPISDEERAAFRKWLNEQKLPATRLSPAAGTSRAQPDCCHLGGPVWLAEGQDWPVSKRGNPMEFLAQLDFSQLPELPGFPREGVLQFFILTDDDLWGMGGWDSPLDGEIAVLHRAAGAGTRRLESPRPDPMEDTTPFMNNGTREQGVALSPSPFTMGITAGEWRVSERYEGYYGREGIEQLDELLYAQTDDLPRAHHIGGYPEFVQTDFRDGAKHIDYDTCLLHLTSDDHVMWGDVGEANFMIRSEDLAKGDYSRVIFWWDCS